MIPTIAVIGDIGIDSFVYCSIDRLNPEAPIPLLKQERSVESLGMAGLVAHMVVALGAEARLVCLGRLAIADLKKRYGIQSSGLVYWDGPTIRKTRYMASTAGRPHQQVLRVDQEVIDQLDDDTKQALIFESERAMHGAAAVILSDYGKGTLAESVIWNVIRMAKLRGVPVLVDPFRGCKSWKRYAGAAVIKANRSEAQAAGFVWGDKTVAEPTYRGDWHAGNVVVTLDGDGYVLANRYGESVHPAAVHHSVSDVVGAGDQFAATMAVAIAGGFGADRRDIDNACVLGNIAAGLQVCRSGCVPVTAAELNLVIGSIETEPADSHANG